ncbi:MAG: chorismate synthase [Candidatus Hydrogenedentes bacterium]|nr:chorismate synthase [Candidatus Hydrogenedentota bacterium]
MNIVLIGPKGSGKTAVGAALAPELGLPCVETDELVEAIYARDHEEKRSYREIFRGHGEDFFRELEREAAKQAAQKDWHIVITGGGTFLDTESRASLRKDALILYLTAEQSTLWTRATQGGVPPWLEGPEGESRFAEQCATRDEILRPFADVLLDTTHDSPEDLAVRAAEKISDELAIRCRSANTFGDIVRVTTFGESHGVAIGAILEGIHPDIEISEAIIQKELDRRRPGQSKLVTQRNEPDKVKILSGIFEGKTTGAPIALVIENKDQDSSKYDEIRELFRPGHADYTFYKKYGHRDHRGGGRSSGRETATRVAAGAVASEILRKRGVTFRAYAVEVGGIKAETCDYEVIESNPVRCADPKAAVAMEEAILAARKDQDSVGGVIQLDILGLPAGLGDPVFAKLDARLTYGIMTIGAIKGVEIGGGFALTGLRGSESNDEMQDGAFLSNNAGGITGGISTGQTVTLRVAVKPTASIASTQQTIDTGGKNTEIRVGGRHDPCIVPRAVPVIEHMAALVILDAWEIQQRINPDWSPISQ